MGGLGRSGPRWLENASPRLWGALRTAGDPDYGGADYDFTALTPEWVRVKGQSYWIGIANFGPVSLEELGRLIGGWDGEAPECALCVPTCQECCGEAHEPDLVEARIAALEIRVSKLERGLAELLMPHDTNKAEEIEVTEEMIEAGLTAFFTQSSGWDGCTASEQRAGLVAVFRAMLSASGRADTRP